MSDKRRADSASAAALPETDSTLLPQTTASRWTLMRDRSISGTLAAAAFSQLALVVSGVLAARILGPTDRGYLALLVVVSSLCALAGGFGLPAALTYYVARNHAHARAIVAALIRPALGQIAVTLMIQTAILVALVRHEPHRVQVAAAASLLLIPGILFVTYGLALLQGLNRFDAFNALRVLPTAAHALALAIAFGLGVGNLILLMGLWVLTTFFGGILMLFVAMRRLPQMATDEPAPSVPALTKFGLKSLLSSLSPVDALRLDQMVVGLFLSPAALGNYVVSLAFTGLPRLVASSIGMVAYPRIAADRDPASARRKAWRYFAVGMAFSATIIGILAVTAGTLVTFFFGVEFTGAASIARILLIGVLFMTARRLLTDIANGLGRPEFGTIAEIASWIVLIPALALLLPPLGVEGVAIALAIAWGIALAVIVYLLASAKDRPRAQARAVP